MHHCFRSGSENNSSHQKKSFWLATLSTAVSGYSTSIDRKIKFIVFYRLNKRFSSQHDVHEFERVRLRHEAEELKQQLRVAEEENKRLKNDLSEAEFDPASARIKAHLDHLKTENAELKQSNEDLRDQLAQHLSEARLLVSRGEETSLADEMKSATKDEVMDALKKQEQINEQLRSYLERITLTILERNPEILEIK